MNTIGSSSATIGENDTTKYDMNHSGINARTSPYLHGFLAPWLLPHRFRVMRRGFGFGSANWPKSAQKSREKMLKMMHTTPLQSTPELSEMMSSAT
mmetsp:Transcript_29721/g.40325  ORF Transcript_29721/g.40325 Transcript_29721/m.40325 type:complete len:96 (+) Transcript_29721:160-447(+)